MRFKSLNKLAHTQPLYNGLDRVRIKSILHFPFIFFIRLYKYILSPLLPNSCRYTPTCSQYAEEAIKKYGIIKGIAIGAKRIARCHPWGGHGYDPLV